MRWRWSWLMAAPHRLAFFAAATMLAASALWWTALLAAPWLGLAPPWRVAPAAAHALLMSLGFMPLFMAGFLFTAGPRWLALPQGSVGARDLQREVAAMLAGWACALAGFHLHAMLAGAGVALVALGWTSLCATYAGMLRAGRRADRTHALLAGAACATGAIALWIAAAALFAGDSALLRSAAQLALWGFLAPMFAVVSHRMLPFFSAAALPALDAWWPMWLLWVMLGALWLSALPAIAELWWPLPDAVRWAQAAMEAPVAALLLWLALRWGRVQNLRNRLLAMLHGGFVWLGIAFALAALSHALQAATGAQLSLGLAPMHAMAMGYLGATLFAMATRVSSGHGGRPLAADTPAWMLYWLLQAAVTGRVAAALWPAAAAPLLLAAALAWSAAATGWALRYGRWFGQPRIDGRPG